MATTGPRTPCLGGNCLTGKLHELPYRQNAEFHWPSTGSGFKCLRQFFWRGPHWPSSVLPRRVNCLTGKFFPGVASTGPRTPCLDGDCLTGKLLELAPAKCRILHWPSSVLPRRVNCLPGLAPVKCRFLPVASTGPRTSCPTGRYLACPTGKIRSKLTLIAGCGWLRRCQTGNLPTRPSSRDEGSQNSSLLVAMYTLMRWVGGWWLLGKFGSWACDQWPSSGKLLPPNNGSGSTDID